MANGQIEAVLSLVEAIKNQDVERAAEYFSERFVQHDPGVAEGIEGLRQHLNGLAAENDGLAVVRQLQDGPFVFTQLKARSSKEDFFTVDRLEGDKIVEHWSFSSPGSPPNESGHTQTDGPVQPRHLQLTAKNKEIVNRYYETFHIAGDHTSGDFFAGNLMVRHERGVRDGVHEFLHDVEVLMKHRTIDEVKLLIGQGDLVFIAAAGTSQGEPCVYIDLYRIEGEKIVEHWGFPQMVPPLSERKNNNGML